MPTLQQGTWQYWNAMATCTTSSTTAAWVNWTTSWTANSTLVVDPATNQPNILINYPEVVETPEDRERMERQRAEREERQRQREEHARVIRERAEETLALLLTDEQLEDWRRTSSFRLITQAGHVYRIRRGIAGNVDLIEGDETVERLCAHPYGVPHEDVVIAQVLALRTDEVGFRRTANITPVGQRRRAA